MSRGLAVSRTGICVGSEIHDSSPAMTWRGSSFTLPAVSGSMPLSSAPVGVWPCERITSLRMNGLAPATPGTETTFGITDFHSLKSLEYLRRSAWALVPRIFFLRSASNPLITERTTVSAQTPTETPAMEMAVITTVAGRLRRWPGCKCASWARACNQRPARKRAATTAAAERMTAAASPRTEDRLVGAAAPSARERTVSS